ncbi:50S ribosomal protein L25/general stress protein Ctc [Nocardioides alcanivorans]|uniref:50S ribosomal protein L25/general stress protein Ctc n=1 Tax=Nocardioides alcanivorans TaxID=2897352 RepID=UPI001F29B8CD|nr:50S ribosomal protein L25/general stress protein Ctc [Nocardioides alcanivorans]
MSAEKITAETRTEFGKGAARRLRRAAQIPAVVYEHGEVPSHIALPAHATTMALKKGGANALLALEIEGKEQLALTKQVQVDPIRRVIEHIDFVAVKRGEKVVVDVPVVILGEAVRNTLVVTDSTTVQVEAEATNIPDSFEFSIEGAEPGLMVHASDLTLPEGSVLLSDPELLLVNVTEALDQDLGDESGEQVAEGDTAEATAAAAE